MIKKLICLVLGHKIIKNEHYDQCKRCFDITKIHEAEKQSDEIVNEIKLTIEKYENRLDLMRKELINFNKKSLTNYEQ